ncbi:ANTAR domain-containing protein [Streptomyces sp. NPDC050535]|uniref:ANTAR domain-containing protein n=1 Tax=Streptomyces sp. NPDC050535 TaxID=3365626 RepID=UPI0037ACCB86
MQPSTDPVQYHLADPAADHPPRDTAQAVQRLPEEVDGLRRSLVTRSMIDTALGMIMAVEGCSLDHAWQILEQSSLRAETELRAAAQHLVDEAGTTRTPRSIRVIPLSSLRAAPARDDARH